MRHQQQAWLERERVRLREHTRRAHTEAQRIHCVSTGGLEEGTAPRETVIQTDSTKMATPFPRTGVEFQSGLPGHQRSQGKRVNSSTGDVQI